MVKTGATSRAKLQSNHHQQTNTQFFLQAGCPSCHPTNSVKGENITFHGLACPKLTWGLPTLSLTTNSCWSPRERFALPLISSLMPILQEQTTEIIYNVNISLMLWTHIFKEIAHIPSSVVLDTFSRAIKQFWPDTHQATTHADLTGIQSLITDDRVVTSEPQQLLDCKNTTQR